MAIADAGQVLERFEIAPRRHAELTLPWAEQLLAQAGIARSALDAIAVSRGPGAFTGVRLGLSIAQGIALALDRPLIAISTLAVLAMRAPEGNILAAIDARMGEVYAGSFRREQGQLHALAAEALAAPDALPLPGEGRWHAVGTGFAAADGVLGSRLQGRLAGLQADALPHAADLVVLALAAWQRGEAIAPELVEPAYLRNNVALTLAEQQALRQSR